jgi:hypothetical protein
MYESLGSKMDSKFFLIFDSGVDVFDSVPVTVLGFARDPDGLHPLRVVT